MIDTSRLEEKLKKLQMVLDMVSYDIWNVQEALSCDDPSWQQAIERADERLSRAMVSLSKIVHQIEKEKEHGES